MAMPEQQNVTAHNNESPRKSYLFLLLILIVVVFGGAAFVFYYNLTEEKLERAQVKTEEAYAATKQLQIKHEQLQNNIENLQKELQKTSIDKTKYWKPMVIEHLVHLADLTLNTTKDIKLALAFLIEAKRYANDPELSSINHALNKDIANLEILPVIDVSGTVLKLETINQKINALPIVMPKLAYPEIKEEVTPDEPEKTLWQRFFNSSVQALKNLIIIRHKPASLLLTPDQEAILRLEIQAKLFQAELAVMQSQNKVYQGCLEEVTELFSKYFVASQYEEILSLLQELKNVNFEQTIPFPIESMAAITNFTNANKLMDEQPASVLPTPPVISDPVLPGPENIQKEGI
jgi:uroporphyrin-III C-methyltransferase